MKQPDHDALRDVVRSLEAGATEFFPGKELRGIELEGWILREYSHLAMLRVRFAAGDRKICVKFYRHPHRAHDFNAASASKEYEAHRRLSAVFEGIESYSVIEPVAGFPEQGAWAMEFVEGRTLDAVLRSKGNRLASSRSGDDLRRYARLAGQWLQRLQEGTRGDGEPGDEHPGPIGAIRSKLETEGLFTDAERRRILDCAERLCREVGELSAPVVGMHGECFTPHHVFVSDGRIVVFDITGIRYGPPYEDLVSFWVGLEALLKYPVFRRRDIDRLQAAYLEGYAPDFPLSETAFELYKLKHMLGLLNSLHRSSKSSRMRAVRTWAGRSFVKNWVLERVGA